MKKVIIAFLILQPIFAFFIIQHYKPDTAVILAVIFLHIVLYVVLYEGFISERHSITAQVMDKPLGEVKQLYLSLNGDKRLHKLYLEDLFETIGINQGIHPTPHADYKPIIETTIDLSDYRRFTAFRQIQRQMRIDIIFKTTDMDSKLVRGLAFYN